MVRFVSRSSAHLEGVGVHLRGAHLEGVGVHLEGGVGIAGKYETFLQYTSSKNTAKQ